MAGMIISRLLKVQLVLVVITFLSTPVYANLGSIGKVLLRELVGNTSKLPEQLIDAKAVLDHFPAFRKVAIKIGKDFPVQERKQLAEELENIFIRELNRRGYSQSTVLACSKCIPNTLADNINSRAIDILYEYHEALAKISFDSDDIRIVDNIGNPIVSNKDTQLAFREVLKHHQGIWRNISFSAWPDFLESIGSAISKGGLEAEVDAEKRTLSITLQTGMLKGKVASIDLAKLFDRAKIFLGDGGLAALGYSAAPSGDKHKKNNNESVRYILLERLSSSERKKLIQEVEIQYITELIKKRKSNK